MADLDNFVTMKISSEIGASASRNSPQNIQYNYVKFLDHDRSNEQTFCNFTIITDVCSFQVHKCLVGVASEFFKTSMTTEMKEKYQNSVTVHNISADVMETVLDYIYGNEVTLTVANCFELFVASDFLQIPQLIASCRNFLNRNVAFDYCTVMSFWIFAKQHSLDDLLRRCKNYIKKNFESLSNREEIMNMPFDTLETYLRIRDESTSEKCFCEFIINWIDFDKTNREEHFPMLFKLVNLDKLDKLYISSKLLDNKLILENPDSLHQLMTSLKTHMDDDMPTALSRQMSDKPHKQPHFRDVSSQSAFHSSHEFILIQLDSNEAVSKKYDVSTKTWSYLPTLVGNFEFSGVACMEKVLYIMGGCEDFSTAAKDSHRLELTNNSNGWISDTSMPQERHRFGCAVFGDLIFVAGGRFGDDSPTYFKTVYCYSIHNDEWTEKASMNYYRAGCCLVAHEDRLYALGGNARSFYHPTVEIFDGVNWTLGSRMQRWRTDFAAVVLNNRLYAIGGKCNDNIYCREVEAYDFEEKEWKNVASLNVPRAEHGACVVHGMIYVAGGKNHKGWDMPIEYYDPEINVWKAMSFKTDPKRTALVTL